MANTTNKSNAQENVAVDVPYGKLHIGPRELEDHVAMRANQLSAMLLLIDGEGEENFAALNENSRNSFLNLAYHLSAEIKSILPFMTAREGAAA